VSITHASQTRHDRQQRRRREHGHRTDQRRAPCRAEFVPDGIERDHHDGRCAGHCQQSRFDQRIDADPRQPRGPATADREQPLPTSMTTTPRAKLQPCVRSRCTPAVPLPARGCPRTEAAMTAASTRPAGSQQSLQPSSSTVVSARDSISGDPGAAAGTLAQPSPHRRGPRGQARAGFRRYRARMNERVLSEDNRDQARLLPWTRSPMAEDGALPKQTGLLGPVASLVLRCDDCVKYHLAEGRAAGSTARRWSRR